jgi:hypothetical protein
MRAVTLTSGGLKEDPQLSNRRAFHCPALRVARFLATRLIHTLQGDAHLKSQISTQPSLSAVYNAAPRRDGPHTRALRRTTARLFETAFLRPVNGHRSSIIVEHCLRSRRTTGVQSSSNLGEGEEIRTCVNFRSWLTLGLIREERKVCRRVHPRECRSTLKSMIEAFEMLVDVHWADALRDTPVVAG